MLTTDEVAALTHTAPATVRWWRTLGRGPVGFKVGRRILYRQQDVEAWLVQCQAADPLSHLVA